VGTSGTCVKNAHPRFKYSFISPEALRCASGIGRRRRAFANPLTKASDRGVNRGAITCRKPKARIRLDVLRRGEAFDGRIEECHDRGNEIVPPTP
jgi:hypothetical protein